MIYVILLSIFTLVSKIQTLRSFKNLKDQWKHRCARVWSLRRFKKKNFENREFNFQRFYKDFDFRFDFEKMLL